MIWRDLSPVIVYPLLLLAAVFLRSLIDALVTKKNVEGRKPGLRDTLSLMVFISCWGFGALAAAWSMFQGGTVDIWLYIGGISLFALAFIGRIRTLRKIGSSFTVLMEPVENGSLVTVFPYNLVRHPLYLLFLLEIAGFLAAGFNYVTLACLLLGVAVAIYRIGVEERCLRERYGSLWENYSSRTRRLIPFVY